MMSEPLSILVDLLFVPMFRLCSERTAVNVELESKLKDKPSLNLLYVTTFLCRG